MSATLAPTTAGGLESPLLRDSRHRAARAARELEDWLDYLRVSNRAARTIDSYERTCAAVLRAFPDRAFDEFTDGDLLQVLAEFPAKSRHQNKSALNGWFTWGRKTRRLRENPCDLLPQIRYRPPRVHDVFSEAETEALCGLPAPDGQLMTVLLWTGIRRQEARMLTAKRVDFARRRLVVIEGAKGSKERTVPLLPAVAVACDELIRLEGLDRHGFLWYDRPGGHRNAPLRHSKPISNTSFSEWWKRCIEAAGVRYRNPHMSRHSFATRLRHAGLPMEDIQRFLGHESVQTTSDLYVHASDDERADRMMEAFA